MRKYYYEPTIEKTLHCNKKFLEKMIQVLVGNRKPVDQSERTSSEKNFSAGKNSRRKKLAPRGAHDLKNF